MSANLENCNPQGYAELNINEPAEIQRWMEHWNVTEVELRKTVADVGIEVDAVRNALGR